ncbi:MAG: hypothetical protein WD894_10720 [Pirellulales bacterium]
MPVVLAVLSPAASAQEPQRPYGPFDAIAEGTERSEAQRLSLIGAQLETVDQLRLTQVAGPRAFSRDPGVAAVYPYGRRGILGLRPRGYIVVRRPPTVAYRRSYAVEPPRYDFDYDTDAYAIRQTVRQPIGHELLRTGPNRWEYRPLYAQDDRQLDETHREIERNLRPLADDDGAERTGYFREDRRPRGASRAAVPEELPEPQDPDNGGTLTKNDAASPRRGEARDIARDNRVPPPPQPDPPDQPRKDDVELRGPLLQNPSTGAREF